MTFSLMLIKYSGPSTGLEKHVKYSTVTYDMSYDDAIDQFIKTTMEMEGKITWNDAQLLLFILDEQMYTCKRKLIIGICRTHTLQKERSSISHCRPLSEETLFSLSVLSLVYGITQTSPVCIHSTHLSKDSDTSLSPIKPGILNSLVSDHLVYTPFLSTTLCQEWRDLACRVGYSQYFCRWLVIIW